MRPLPLILALALAALAVAPPAETGAPEAPGAGPADGPAPPTAAVDGAPPPDDPGDPPPEAPMPWWPEAAPLGPPPSARLRDAPAAPPGRALDPDDPSRVGALLRAGRPEAALAVAEHLAAHGTRRHRAAAWLAVGMLHREAGRPNLASEAFTRARVAGGALAPMASFHEAEQDALRGRQAVAIRECEVLSERWPDDPHVDACAMLVPLAHAELGHRTAALEAAEAWDTAHPVEPVGEQVRLRLAAHALETEGGDVPWAVRTARELTVHFAAPMTERVARRLLRRAADLGHPDAEVPDDPWSRARRATSLRDTGRKAEAWALFEGLLPALDDDPGLARWHAESATTFGWRCHAWDALAELYAARHRESPDDDSAWLLYRALERGGRYDEAADVVDDALTRWASTRRWRREEERLARTNLLAGRYGRAAELFAEAAERRGWTGERARLYGAYARLRAGDTDAARTAFDALIADDVLETEARYWRATLAPDTAEADRAWILRWDPDSWYATLLRQAEDPPAVAHVGAVQPRRPPAPVPATRVTHRAAPDPGPIAFGSGRRSAADWAALRWPYGPGPEGSEAAPPAAPLAATPATSSPPSGRFASGRHGTPVHEPTTALYDAAAAREALGRLATRHGDAWPALDAVDQLTAFGLDEVAGPMLARFYEDFDKALRYRRADARALDRDVDAGTWRVLFQLAGDHHHASRFSYGLRKRVSDDLRLEAARLAMPLAYAPRVWRHAPPAGVDPWMVLGLMRIESLYNPNALSRVGARGPMQIMPRTGHLLAHLEGDAAFTAADLHDPGVAVDMGITYLGRLLERFDGVFPLAVASYNGGPHNVSAWLKGTGTEMPLDHWVEHIPYGETRRYVRSVTGAYDAYVRLYTAEGRVRVPDHPLGDDPSVVDF